MESIVTIELGTNAVRVCAFDLKGNIVGSQKGFYPIFHPAPDYSEQDPDQVFITMLHVLKSLLNDIVYPNKYSVASICFSASMHSLLAVDKNTSPMGNAIMWSDNRAKNETAIFKSASFSKKIYNATGTPIHPMSPFLKIVWMKNNDESRFKKTAKFLSLKSYIIHQLTGQYLMDYSIASATGLFNVHTKQWEGDALKYAGINTAKLPELVSVFTNAGKLKKAYQNLLGLSASTKIIVGSSDGCMAVLGDGINGEGKANITIEDSGAVRVIGSKVLQDEKQRFFNYVLDDNYYVSGGPTNNGGVIFEWFTKHLSGIAHAFDNDQNMIELIKEAAKVNTGSDGLLFLPYLFGERAPIWNANAKGAYFGLNINHDRKHFMRATIEGILYEIYSIGKILEEHRSIKSLSVNGSFGTIPFISQMLADMFNKPVQVRKNYHSVSFGSFLVAAVNMKIFASLEDAAASVILNDNFKPNKKNSSIYAAYYPVFERLSTKLFEEFDAISLLQQKNSSIKK